MQRLLSVLLVLMLLPAFPAAEAGNEARSDTDRGYLSEQWSAGLGTALGALDSIVAADIDNDGEDELVVGNAQGYLHILDWNATDGKYRSQLHSVDLGSSVRGLIVDQLDEDDALEIVYGYKWSGGGKVRIMDGDELQSEENWTSGNGWANGYNPTDAEIEPYGLVAGDLDGDGHTELVMGADLGHLWVVDAVTPQIYDDYVITPEEAEWNRDLQEDFNNEQIENAWGVAMGQLDSDPALEIAVSTKQGWVGVFDGQTGERQIAKKFGGTADGYCYGLLAADLDGSGIDELVVGCADQLVVFRDGNQSQLVVRTDLKAAYGLEAVDLGFSDGDPELVVAEGDGDLHVLKLGSSDDSLLTQVVWDSGESMSNGAGVTVSLMHAKPWVIHGGDDGVLKAWEIDGDNNPQLVWSTEPQQGEWSPVYSLPGGQTWGVAAGNIDDDPALEVLVGCGSGQVIAFDGETHVVDWVSPVLEKLPVGIVVADLDNDGEVEIAISTGAPDEGRVSGEGGEGYLYVFDRSGGSFTQSYKSGNIDSALGLAVAELDDSTDGYPEIGIATGYIEYVLSGTEMIPYPHGEIRVFGYGSSGYDEEWSSGDLDEVVAGLAAGNADDDAQNELVAGTALGDVRVYHASGGGYSLDGSIIDSGREGAYGLALSDVDDDGNNEILVGTAKKGDEKARVIIYNGESHLQEWDREVDTGSIWGIAGGDFDNDTHSELIWGTNGGELYLYDGEAKVYEAKTSALSGMTGHYGGLKVADLQGDGVAEIITGSNVYLWVMTSEGQTDTPDLEVVGDDITVSWNGVGGEEPAPAGSERPTEDNDLQVSVTFRNQGGAATSDWLLTLYDGEPRQRDVAEFECHADEGNQSDGCEVLTPGAELSLELYWGYLELDPGHREVYVEVIDLSSQETRKSNNADFTTVDVDAVPNDAPHAVATLDTTTVWVDEVIRIDARESWDNETTNGDADDDDGQHPDLKYRYYHPGPTNLEDEVGWTSWQYDWDRDVSFSEPGDYSVRVQVSDNRSLVSESVVLPLTVKANSPPVAMLNGNATAVVLGGHVIFDFSASYDPDYRNELEYRIDFNDGVYSDWLEEGGVTLLYRNPDWNDQNGNLESGDPVRKSVGGSNWVFKLVDGQFLEVDNSGLTGNGYNYTLPAGKNLHTYHAMLVVRELSSGLGDDDLLTSGPSGPFSVTVSRATNQPPLAMARVGVFIEGTAIFSDTGIEAQTGEAVTFSAAESSDPDGDNGALTFEWTVVDSLGNPVNLLGDRDKGSFSKVFNTPGTYIATVIVEDERGERTSSNTVQVMVKAPVTANGGDGEGLDLMKLLGLVLLGTVLLAGGAMMAGRLRSGGGEAEFDDAVDGPLELACPSCNSTLAIHTPQRPIQVGCPHCQSQFILRE